MAANLRNYECLKFHIHFILMVNWILPLQGGADLGAPIKVSHVERNSPGDKSEILRV